MKVTIITMGSRGDVQPFIALAKGLDAAGHEATVASQAPFEQMVTSQGVRFARLGDRPDAIEKFDEFSRLQYDAGRRAYKIMKHANQWIFDLLDDQMAGGDEACRDADLLVEGTMGMLTAHLAERYDIPFVRAYLRPETRTAQYRRPDLVYPESRFAWRRRGSYSLVMMSVWTVIRARVNEWRAARDLESWGLANPTQYHHYTHRFPVVLGYSEKVAPREDDYPAWHHITGFWPLDGASSYEAPAELETFLDGGAPPITIGFGSIPVLDPSAMWDTVLDALERTKQRAVVLTGWGGLDRREDPEQPDDTDRRRDRDDVLALEAVPHDWLYPRSLAAIHHGGAGAAAASFRAGVPTVIVPFLWDQLFWGQRAHALGVGPAPIMQAELGVDRLVDAINASATNTLRSRAAELGRDLQAEEGLASAVQLLERTVDEGRAACLRKA
jgi:sterol 3beta-glucosyltransferase